MMTQNTETKKQCRHRYFLIEIQTGLEGSQIHKFSDSFILEVF